VFHEAVPFVTFALTDLSRYLYFDTMFFNVNTADELEQAEAMCQRRA